MEISLTLRWDNETERAAAAALLRRMADALDGGGPIPSATLRREAAPVPMEAPSRSQAWTVEDVVAVLLGCADPEAAALVLLNIATWQRIGNGITEAELCRRALVNQAGLYRVLSDIGQQHDAAFPDRPDLLLTWTSGEERYWTMEPTTAQTALLALPRFQVIHGGGASFPPDLT